MQAGIITFTNGTNYGQRLQNFAVQYILRKYQYDVFTLKQREPYFGYYHNIKKGIKALLQPKCSFYEYKRKKIFAEFDKKNIRFYSKIVHEGMDFSKIDKAFDIFVAGSDQIWNPFSCDVNSIYFLSFTESKKRVALAPSFAVDDIPEDRAVIYRKYISEFDALSIRENTGALLIKKLCQRDVPVILDPTLIIEREVWEQLARKPSQITDNKYVLVYFLGSSQQKQTIHSWANSQNLNVIDLIADHKWYSTIGPAEFLYMIQNAEIVFTDSYHGTIFSIHFRKKFRNFERKSNGFSMSSRFETLYYKLGISKENACDLNNFEQYLDYAAIYSALSKEQEKTKKYLEMALLRKDNQI